MAPTLRPLITITNVDKTQPSVFEKDSAKRRVVLQDLAKSTASQYVLNVHHPEGVARSKDYVMEHPREILRHIANGSKSDILDVTGSSHVLKKAALSRKLPSDTAKNEYHNHVLVETAFKQHPQLATQVCLPRVIARPYIPKDADTWHNAYLYYFPIKTRRKADIHVMERIYPVGIHMQRHLRKFLIQDPYTNQENSEKQSLVQPFDVDFLPFVCLSRFSNRDCKEVDDDLVLTTRVLRQLDADIIRLVMTFADILAILHWVAHIDAAGIEFVLGGRPQVERAQQAATIPSAMCSELSRPLPISTPLLEIAGEKGYLWIMDFDECQALDDLDQKGCVMQAADRYIESPFFPKPWSIDPHWDLFAHRYVQASTILGKRSMAEEFVRIIDLKWYDMYAKKTPNKMAATSSDETSDGDETTDEDDVTDEDETTDEDEAAYEEGFAKEDQAAVVDEATDRNETTDKDGVSEYEATDEEEAAHGDEATEVDGATDQGEADDEIEATNDDETISDDETIDEIRSSDDGRTVQERETTREIKSATSDRSVEEGHGVTENQTAEMVLEDDDHPNEANGAVSDRSVDEGHSVTENQNAEIVLEDDSPDEVKGVDDSQIYDADQSMDEGNTSDDSSGEDQGVDEDYIPTEDEIPYEATAPYYHKLSLSCKGPPEVIEIDSSDFHSSDLDGQGF